MAELYRIFSKDWEAFYDYSDSALEEMYKYESLGGVISENNGYYLGKKWLNVQVSMWREDIESGLLFKSELYSDERFPHWWLDSVLSGTFNRDAWHTDFLRKGK